VFISYRRSDAASASRQLAQALERRFGADSVFFDTHSIEIGAHWRSLIESRIRAADVVLAVIGPRWISFADERGRRTVLNPVEEDVLRSELEVALQSGSLVFPVLVDDAEMPARERLPRPFRPLAGLEAMALRHSSWDQDVDALLNSLENRVLAMREASTAAATVESPELDDAVASAAEVASSRSAGGPRDHYADLAQYLSERSLVPVLGSGANAVTEHPGQAGDSRDALPTGDELARLLVRRFRLRSEAWDLARVSQHIVVSRGAADLHRALSEILIKSRCTPGPVHRFLARLPGLLRAGGHELYQLIVTANYDETLERAFDSVHEPFDLVVFMAAGEYKGRFIHIPWWDGSGDGVEPGPILFPNAYVHLPIDEDGVLSRTVILKIHGGVLHDAPPEYQVKHNFVVTEDDYIGFLTRGSVESLIPFQILSKLRESHLLFLGYAIRDWSLRVFLRRLWSEQQPAGRSWAVQPTVDTVDSDFWRQFNADRLDVPLGQYVGELEAVLAATPAR
jgi:hypothetical protein